MVTSSKVTPSNATGGGTGRFGPGENGTVGLDKMQRRLETVAWQFRKIGCDARVLKWQIINGLVCGVLPAANPEKAKRAVSVIDGQWFGRW